MNRLVATILFSIVIAPAAARAGCTIYEHRDYGGAEYTLGHLERMLMEDGESIGCQTSHGDGCESIIYDSAWDESVSSFRVTPGCTLTLWEDIDDEETIFRSSRSYRYVGDDWNDEASEALCLCR